MSEEIKTEFNTEGQPAFPVENKENDNSPGSSPVENETDPTGASDQDKDKKTENKKGGGEENFADHPRWKEREEDWKKRFNDQETRHTEDIAKLREDFAPLNKSKDGADAPIKVPSWFGGEEIQWREFQQWNESLVSKAKDEARTEVRNEIETKSTAEKKAIDDATTYFNDEVVSLETDKAINPDGVKIDRNKLLKFVLDNDLVDSKGRWNYRAGFTMMRGSASAKNDSKNDRKELAGATTSGNRAETKPPAYTTSEDFKKPANRPW